ncbi:LacI family DNA-binding transcriptional regulator [Vallicoccus soli]|uniref:LacI family transcriptional regulator n=1 Tax=Vallicoccus soli TaxID=2339232 RepID=A0A3A3YXM3_9ACTN|nr:LacI family DNA-binding transcriptional regulator [Vallicoccus soli]RJK95463.1 LacI family transcriptional regulator [Vallicoccus soli]
MSQGTAPGRATLQSVARAARVSRQTVSNALNAPHVVSPETLQRVLAAVDELGYRPSRAARQLRTRRSHTLAMRLDPFRDGVNGSVLDRFLHALVEGAQGAGYRVLLFTAEDDAGELERYAELLEASDVDGFVLTGTHAGDPRSGWLAERGVPHSAFGRPWDDPAAPLPDAERGAGCWVDVDGAVGTRAAVGHLVASGHRRIAFVGWPAGSGSGDLRRSGWREACAERGLELPDHYDVAVPDGVDAGRASASALLTSALPPTAIVCASDSLALGVLAVAAEAEGAGGLGEGTPATAVVGFDDTPAAAAVGLTSVAQPLAEAARTCLDQLLAQLDEGASPCPPRLLPPELVVRRSTRGARP